MSTRVTRSQVRRQKQEGEVSPEKDRESGSGSGSPTAGPGVNMNGSGEDTPRRGRGRRRGKNLLAVQVEIVKDEKGEVDERKEKVNGEAGAEMAKDVKKVKGVNGDGEVKRVSHKFESDVEKGGELKLEEKTAEPANPKSSSNRATKEAGEIITVNGIIEVNGTSSNTPPATRMTNGTVANAEDSGNDDGSSSDDEAPEAVSNAAGRDLLRAREEEARKAREQQEVALRLKRKAHDERLKEQKQQSLQSTSTTPITSSNKRPKFHPSPPPHDRKPTDSAEPSDTNTGILSPTSSTTLSLQYPPLDPNHPRNRRNNKPPLLLPESLLEEVARLPSPPPQQADQEKKKKPAVTPAPVNKRKTLSDFEAEEKLALELIKQKKGKKMVKFNKGPVKVAVIGKDEQREKEKKVMAPRGVGGVERVKNVWLMGRKAGGVERRGVLVGGSSSGFGKGFARRN
ncbi:hypothetical protein BDZ91DRAFT_158907 [Kalaharituber pfeilii]|nr:hypothetical protein BDZ91DRAFT_158907 [Kalaharituber pfeilii]